MSDYLYLFSYISLMNIIAGWIMLLLVGVVAVHLISLVMLATLGGMAKGITQLWYNHEERMLV